MVPFGRHADESDRIRSAIMMLESSVRQMKEEIHRANDLAQSYTKRLQNVELSILHLRQEVKDEVTQLIGNAKQWHEELLKVADTRKELESVEEGFYAKVREISELTIRISQLENLLQTLESRLSKIDELLTQQEEHVASANTMEQDIFEGKLFSEQVMNALRSAHQSLEAPSMMPPYIEWLTVYQRRLLPLELDVLAAVYLLRKTEIAPITTSIETILTWMQRGRITDIATGLVALGLLSLPSRGHDKDERPPRVYDLTDTALAMFVPCSSSTGTLHREMELLTLEEAFRWKPPKYNVCVPQLPGEVRCDRLLIERVDSKVFDYPGAVGVQVETPEEVRAHSAGQVFLNMILPFSYGLRRVIIVCLPESVEKLTEMRNGLPTWLRENIEVRAVEL